MQANKETVNVETLEYLVSGDDNGSPAFSQTDLLLEQLSS